jgi:hypothetical protein
VISIEDTTELQCPVENYLDLRAVGNVTMLQLTRGVEARWRQHSSQPFLQGQSAWLEVIASVRRRTASWIWIKGLISISATGLRAGRAARALDRPGGSNRLYSPLCCSSFATSAVHPVW